MGKEAVGSLREATDKGNMMETVSISVFFWLSVLLWSSKGSRQKKKTLTGQRQAI